MVGCGDGARGAGDGALGAGLWGSLNLMGRGALGVSPVGFLEIAVSRFETVVVVVEPGADSLGLSKSPARTAMTLVLLLGRPRRSRGAGLLTCRPRGMGICSAISMTCG
jgi:hypothetical protein